MGENKVKIILNFFCKMKEIIIVSDNPGKIKEYQDKLKSYKLIPYKEVLPIEHIPEEEDTFKANAFIKADTVFRILKKPCLADDSGLIVDALPNELGVHSKRFSEEMTDQANNQLLLEKLKDIDQRQAKFKTVICLLIPGEHPRFYQGEVKGKILRKARGNQGFGYDPLFYIEGLNKTLAEMTIDEKNIYSHRAKAIEALIKDIENENIVVF
ncbi:RdgB/HAM1 family non-canonical purine NTP pyrophosphatase [Mycoplasmatota bacterium]|nr:RdgB/HAM1 family non-canonical purine NTP pyrophosphatase [Mycoplasmatota bacterium]